MTASSPPITPEPEATRWLPWCVVATVALSRLTLIPGEAWEQDEALFAAAGLDLDLTERRPHPPGFPAWVAVARLGAWLVGDPLTALQIASALVSILGVVLLARLSFTIVHPTVAWAGALVFAFLPGVWVHAPRAFSSTAATTAAFAAALAWLRPGGWSAVGAGGLLAVAALLRPPLVPPLALVAVMAAWQAHREPRRIVLGLVAGAGVSLAGLAPVVVDTGGVGAWLAAVGEHGGGHAGALDLASWSFAGLGLVKAAGGSTAAVLLVVAALVGSGALARRDPRTAAAWTCLAVATAAWILLAHNRTYPRYAIPALALLVPLAARGLKGLAGVRRSAGLLAAAALVAALAAWPTVQGVAEGDMPVFAAIADAQQAPTPASLVLDTPLSPFRDLLVLSGRGSRPLLWRDGVITGAEAPPPGPWRFVWADGAPHRWRAAPEAEPAVFTVAEAAHRQGQGRFLTAWWSEAGALLLDDGVVPAGGLGPGRHRLLTGPTPRGSALALAVEGTGDRGRVVARSIAGVELVAKELPDRAEHRLDADSRRAMVASATGDGRRNRRGPVAERLGGAPRGAKVLPCAGRELHPHGRGGLVVATGFHGVERLGEPRTAARWSGPIASVTLPVAAGGALEVELACPRPGPVDVRVAVEGGAERRVTVSDHRWRRVRLPVGPGSVATVRLEASPPLIPGDGDSRRLGIAVASVGSKRGGSDR